MAGDDSGGRRAGSLSRADLDRGFAERRSAMDYAIGRLAGGGSEDTRRAERDCDSLISPASATDGWVAAFGLWDVVVQLLSRYGHRAGSRSAISRRSRLAGGDACSPVVLC